MAPKNRRIHTQDLSSPAKLRRQKEEEEEEVPMVTRDKVYKQKNKELPERHRSRDFPVTRVINNKEEEDYVARNGITPARKEMTPATERFNVSGVVPLMINNRRPSVSRTGTPTKTEIPKGALLPAVKKKKKTDEGFPTTKEIINPATSCSKSFIHRGVQKQIDRNRASMVHHPERMVTSLIQTRRLEALRFLKCAQMKRRGRKKQSWDDSSKLSRKLDETNATSKDYESVELNLLRDLSSYRLEIIMSNLKIETLKLELNRIPKGDYTKHEKWHGVLRSKTATMGRRHGKVEWEKKRAEVMREEMSRCNLVLQFHQLKSIWKETRNKKYASLIIEEAKKSELLKEAATTEASKIQVGSGPVDWTSVHCTA